VSHDRAFLDNVVTSVLASEGGGRWKEYAGGYTDWQRQVAAAASGQPPATPVEEAPAAKAPAREKPRAKLSYKESRELEALPAQIEALEAEQQALQDKMSRPDYYKLGAEELKKDRKRADEIEALLMEKLERWEALEAKASAAAS